jgi:hypothetical protein
MEPTSFFAGIGFVAVFMAIGAAATYLLIGALNWADYWISANRSRRANRTVTGVWHKIGGEWVEQKRED